MRKLIVITLLAIAGFATTANADWVSRSDTDQMTDETKTFATVYNKAENAAITVRCMRNSFDILYTNVTQYFADEYVALVYRVDKEESRILSAYGTSGKSVFIEDDSIDYFVQALKSGNSIKIQSSGYSSRAPEVKTFTLKGSTAAINKVIEACK